MFRRLTAETSQGHVAPRRAEETANRRCWRHSSHRGVAARTSRSAAVRHGIAQRLRRDSTRAQDLFAGYRAHRPPPPRGPSAGSRPIGSEQGSSHGDGRFEHLLPRCGEAPAILLVPRPYEGCRQSDVHAHCGGHPELARRLTRRLGRIDGPNRKCSSRRVRIRARSELLRASRWLRAWRERRPTRRRRGSSEAPVDPRPSREVEPCVRRSASKEQETNR